MTRLSVMSILVRDLGRYYIIQLVSKLFYILNEQNTKLNNKIYGNLKNKIQNDETFMLLVGIFMYPWGQMFFFLSV